MNEPIYVEPLHYQCAKCGCSHTTRYGALECDHHTYKQDNETIYKGNIY